MPSEQPFAGLEFGEFIAVPFCAQLPLRGVLANPVRLDGDGFEPAPITPVFGSEARDLLGAAGFSAAEIHSFIALGVTRESIGKT
jgi:hypothetical protein